MKVCTAAVTVGAAAAAEITKGMATWDMPDGSFANPGPVDDSPSIPVRATTSTISIHGTQMRVCSYMHAK